MFDSKFFQSEKPKRSVVPTQTTKLPFALVKNLVKFFDLLFNTSRNRTNKIQPEYVHLNPLQIYYAKPFTFCSRTTWIFCSQFPARSCYRTCVVTLLCAIKRRWQSQLGSCESTVCGDFRRNRRSGSQWWMLRLTCKTEIKINYNLAVINNLRNKHTKHICDVYGRDGNLHAKKVLNIW